LRHHDASKISSKNHSIAKRTRDATAASYGISPIIAEKEEVKYRGCYIHSLSVRLTYINHTIERMTKKENIQPKNKKARHSQTFRVRLVMESVHHYHLYLAMKTYDKALLPVRFSPVYRRVYLQLLNLGLFLFQIMA
jgi:hypothetical protein